MGARKRTRNEAILGAVRQGVAFEVAARRYGVPLRRVLALSQADEQRERFAQEHAESGGRMRVRILGSAR
jgi:hypothetical protein